MAAVVNILRFMQRPDLALFEQAAEDLGPRMREVPGFARLEIVRTGETEVLLIIFAESTTILDDIATRIGSPWMIQHVVPLLASPPDRHIGEAIASVTR
jgi:hypothetical protein